MRRDRFGRPLVIACTFGLVSMAGWMGVRTGRTIDNDTYALEGTFRRILEGGYLPSRTSGYPLYEYVGAGVWGLFQRPGVMWLSLIATLCALALLLRPTRAFATWFGTASWALLALTPVVLTNASSIMETSFLLLVSALLAWWLSRPIAGLGEAIAGAGIAVVIVATRPDAVLLVMATAAALVFSRVATRARLMASGALAVGALAGLGLDRLITGVMPFSSSFVPDEAPVRRLARGALGVVTGFGPLGAILLVVFAGLVIAVGVRLLRSRAETSREPRPAEALSDTTFLVIWTLLALVLYGVRFLLLADEVEYLLPAFVVIAVVIPNLARSMKTIGIVGVALMASAATTSLVSVSLLQRSDPWQVEPGVSPTLQPGGFIQDIRARDATRIREGDGYAAFLESSTREFTQAVRDGTTVILPRDNFYFIVNSGYKEYFRKVDTVVGCRELTTGTLIPGWRVSQPAGAYADLDAFDEGRPLTCSVGARLTPDLVRPTRFGSAPNTPAEFPR